MAKPELGSTWKKWDLHVHTPESFYHNYPGTNDEAWEAFISDLERLPSEFKVIGINDYVLVDGYEKVLNAKNKQNRLKNIDLILPVIELRLDTPMSPKRISWERHQWMSYLISKWQR